MRVSQLGGEWSFDLPDKLRMSIADKGLRDWRGATKYLSDLTLLGRGCSLVAESYKHLSLSLSLSQSSADVQAWQCVHKWQVFSLAGTS